MNSSVIAGEKPRINSIKTQPTSKRDYTLSLTEDAEYSCSLGGVIKSAEFTTPPKNTMAIFIKLVMLLVESNR